MVLKRPDIACFIANWSDKATNIREIAAQLNIGLDSLVFADDNPFERAIVRRELPMVAVPELPLDPALFEQCLADAGYFETLRVTAEDFQRGHQYQAELERKTLVAATTDLAGYLRSLDMEARWGRFDRVSQTRVVQLINKTNQFNLTTQRTNDEQISALIADPTALTLQIRLIDRFGDNGIIAIVSGRFAAEARRLGATRLIGVYRPTAKNGMVREHYARLGFTAMDADDGEATWWALDLAVFEPVPTFIRSVAVANVPQSEPATA
jgi:FkbH-like protein